MKRKRLYSLSLIAFCFVSLFAQQNPTTPTPEKYQEVRGMIPMNKPGKTTYAVIESGDTIPMGYLTSAFVFPKEMFRSQRDEKYYWKLVRDVKKVYPLSKVVYYTLYETMGYLETIPDERARAKHLRQMEKDLVKEYEPVLRKMTYSQGKILLKLINRECNSSPYELIRAYRGSFAATLWQGVAKIFGEDLKSDYHPTMEDFMIERIVIQIEQGQI
ncbi:MAG: DUF4294 domain-containing protein [Bacteroidales bacterium]|nr:DUF4294 domain-containing protein [Bacteroidales bacterium]